MSLPMETLAPPHPWAGIEQGPDSVGDRREESKGEESKEEQPWDQGTVVSHARESLASGTPEAPRSGSVA